MWDNGTPVRIGRAGGKLALPADHLQLQMKAGNFIHITLWDTTSTDTGAAPEIRSRLPAQTSPKVTDEKVPVSYAAGSQVPEAPGASTPARTSILHTGMETNPLITAWYHNPQNTQ